MTFRHAIRHWFSDHITGRHWMDTDRLLNANPGAVPPLSSGHAAEGCTVRRMKHASHPTSTPMISSGARRPRLRRVLLLGCLAPVGLLAACGNGRPTADGSGGSFCDQLSESSALAESIDNPLENGAQVAGAFERLAQLAPAEIHSDVQAVTDAMVALVTTPTDDPAALSNAVDVLLSPEVTAATERIGHYAMDTCGITPSAWSQT